jgi:cyclophilin family peptidyl-prolyl cis-trans isomerase
MASIIKLEAADIGTLNSLMFDQKEVILSSKAAEVVFDRSKSVELDLHIKTDIHSMINRALHSSDMGLQSAACIALADSNWGLLSNYRDSVSVLKTLQNQLDIPRQLETYIDFEKLIALLENRPYIAPPADLSHKIDWEFVKSIPQNQKVKINTNLGVIVLETYVDQAPGSVSNFLKLVDEGFYNNKVYHRVVPDFVIQGGCPRGDGWGSLDWTQRSEFSNYLKYEAGTVGLASAGRDTEGVQFFITHIPTPHLDGRYTIIGKVVEGMDVVRRIQMGDQIISMVRIP